MKRLPMPMQITTFYISKPKYQQTQLIPTQVHHKVRHSILTMLFTEFASKVTYSCS